jgi:hypothetical protein
MPYHRGIGGSLGVNSPKREKASRQYRHDTVRAPEPHTRFTGTHRRVSILPQGSLTFFRNYLIRGGLPRQNFLEAKIPAFPMLF